MPCRSYNFQTNLGSNPFYTCIAMQGSYRYDTFTGDVANLTQVTILGTFAMRCP